MFLNILYSYFSINIFRKRRDILNPKSKKTPTEYDYVIKIWGPILESLFPEDKIFIKW